MARNNPHEIVLLEAPVGGQRRSSDYQSKPPYYFEDGINVRAFDVLEGRNRISSRPGTNKAYAQKLGEAGVVESFTADFNPTRDLFIQFHSPNTNYSTNPSILVRSFSGGLLRERFLTHFDFGAIPTGATITCATLSLYNHNNSQAPLPSLCKAARLTQTGWVETQATWNAYATAANWITAGGDYTTTDEVSWTLRTDSAEGWHVLSGFGPLVTAAMGLAGGDAKQLHMLFKIDDETAVPASTTWRNTFRPTEYSDPVLRPKLTVTYEVAV